MSAVRTRNGLRVGLLLVAVVALLVAVGGQPVKAAPAVPSFTTLGWRNNAPEEDLNVGQWAEGNLGTWPEGSSFGTQVLISNNSASPMTLTEIDIYYSFYSAGGAKAIGIDWVDNFQYTITNPFSAGDTQRYPGTGWTAFPALQPYISNMPWTTVIGGIATDETDTNLYDEHFWGINPAAFPELPGGVLGLQRDAVPQPGGIDDHVG